MVLVIWVPLLHQVKGASSSLAGCYQCRPLLCSWSNFMQPFFNKWNFVEKMGNCLMWIKAASYSVAVQDGTQVGRDRGGWHEQKNDGDLITVILSSVIKSRMRPPCNTCVTSSMWGDVRFQQPSPNSTWSQKLWYWRKLGETQTTWSTSVFGVLSPQHLWIVIWQK